MISDIDYLFVSHSCTNEFISLTHPKDKQVIQQRKV